MSFYKILSVKTFKNVFEILIEKKIKLYLALRTNTILYD